MPLKTARFFNLVLMLLMTGTFWGTWFGLSPAKRTFSADVYTIVRQAENRAIGPVMPVLMVCVLLSTLVVLWLIRDRRRPAFALTLLAALCIVVAIASTLLINVPINTQTNTWSPAAPPANWMQLRDQWELAHTIRTALALISMGALFLAVILETPTLPSRAAQHKRFQSSASEA